MFIKNNMIAKSGSHKKSHTILRGFFKTVIYVLILKTQTREVVGYRQPCKPFAYRST